MLRKYVAEILDQADLSDDLADVAYRDIAKLHRWLGDTRAIVNAVRRDPLPVRRILDVGCGTGLVLEEIRRRLRVDVIGVDLNPHPSIAAPIPIIRADAVRDSLPSADVAFSMNVCHHLCEGDLMALIRNVGRSCRRFIVMDLVRHRLPLALFRLFIAPFLCAIDAEDGQLSICRSYAPHELRGIVASVLDGTDSIFRHTVAPFYVRQIIDISYGVPTRETAV